MNLSVIIPHYYPARVPNLQRIIMSICTGSVWPDEVIIWNNDPQPVHVPGAVGLPVLVVQSPRNVGSQARLVAALMARGNRVMFLDNDVAVNRRTVENLLRHSSAHPDAAVTVEGRLRTDTEYKRWPKVYGHGVAVMTKVDLSLGRGEMVRRDVLLSVLRNFPFEEKTRMDDLHLSHAYERGHVPIFVVPCHRGIEDLEDLPMYGVGMCQEPGFYEERTRVAKTIVIEDDPESLKSQAERA